MMQTKPCWLIIQVQYTGQVAIPPVSLKYKQLPRTVLLWISVHGVYVCMVCTVEIWWHLWEVNFFFLYHSAVSLFLSVMGLGGRTLIHLINWVNGLLRDRGFRGPLVDKLCGPLVDKLCGTSWTLQKETAAESGSSLTNEVSYLYVVF